MVIFYKLDGHEVVPVEDVRDWLWWYVRADRQVNIDTIGDINISTVFMGTDSNHGEETPLFFETMVFGGPLNYATDRYMTWDEAVIGHDKMVNRVKETLNDKTDDH